MATLKAHGQLLGKITYLTYTCAYMSDGVILRSFGNGWKLYRKVKKGIDPAEHFKTELINHQQRMVDRPAWTEYRGRLHELVCTSDWSRVNDTLTLLHDDPDGCWSELNDYRSLGLDLEEVSELCDKYAAASYEAKMAKLAKTQVAQNAKI